MKKLVERIEKLKQTKIKGVIDSRINDFSYFKAASNEEVFLELCFCFMTANFQAAKSWEIQKKIGNGFFEFGEKELQLKLKNLGHRFWPQRGSRIYEARWLKKCINKKLGGFENEILMRNWIVKNIKGIGMKEASHFLRNIGYLNVAIIDKHIINILVNENLIERPKTLTNRKYFAIENVLRKIGDKTKLTLGELDLYLWNEETGQILK
jgi:N-glycosylase/DNA lyase